MSKADDTVESIKNHRRVDHLVVVQFTQILDLRKATLIELEVILLETQGDLLE